MSYCGPYDLSYYGYPSAGYPSSNSYPNANSLGQTFVSYGGKGAAGDCEDKLDKMTRSRNALLVALIVFVAAFVACFIAVMVVSFATTTATTVTTFTMTFDSDHTDQAFSSTDLSDSASYSYGLMQNIFCNEVTAAASAAGTFTCTVTAFAQGSTSTDTSTKGTVQLVVDLDAKTESTRFTDIVTAVNLATGANSAWSIDTTTAAITVSSGAAALISQVPLLLLALFLIHKML